MKAWTAEVKVLKKARATRGEIHVSNTKSNRDACVYGGMSYNVWITGDEMVARIRRGGVEWRAETLGR